MLKHPNCKHSWRPSDIVMGTFNDTFMDFSFNEIGQVRMLRYLYDAFAKQIILNDPGLWTAF